jgi:hypothetical protein
MNLSFWHDMRQSEWLMLLLRDEACSSNIQHRELACFQKKGNSCHVRLKTRHSHDRRTVLVCMLAVQGHNPTTMHAELVTGFRKRSSLTRQFRTGSDAFISMRISSEPGLSQENHRMALLASKFIRNELHFLFTACAHLLARSISCGP